ncbi:MAG: hypothetical protein EHM48_03110 [Planctomycetaceae bacterium]|nr:MAG: hypothetical protein EHM48_03110 [Planctomycetaceae bacterium]
MNIWIDACFDQFDGKLDHRDIRHNMEGVEIVRKMWGDEAAKAAILHIRLDWGNIPEENIPKDQAQATAFREAIIASYAKKK